MSRTVRALRTLLSRAWRKAATAKTKREEQADGEFEVVYDPGHSVIRPKEKKGEHTPADVAVSKMVYERKQLSDTTYCVAGVLEENGLRVLQGVSFIEEKAR